MKRVLFVLLCVMLALSVQSCSDEVESATLRVEMDKSVRTLSPLIENMEIHGYRVVAVGPDGKERAPQTTNYSYINLENLSVGEWTSRYMGITKII